MPARRSRTERWRDSVEQLSARGGGIEFTLARPGIDPRQDPSTWAEHGADLVWRVRVLRCDEHEIVVEAPAAAGTRLALDPGLAVVAVIAVGQNRWMFHSRILGAGQSDGRDALRLAAPEHVERCQRRSFYRISTAELELPSARVWPLRDPSTVGPAELANRELISSLRAGGLVSPGTDPDMLLPDTAPAFGGRLVNISGGGLGLVTERDDASGFDHARFFWVRVDLTPHIPAPLGFTTKLVHRHMDSTGAIHAGLSFEFGFNPEHRVFVVEQIVGYVASLQDRLRAA